MPYSHMSAGRNLMTQFLGSLLGFSPRRSMMARSTTSAAIATLWIAVVHCVRVAFTRQASDIIEPYLGGISRSAKVVRNICYNDRECTWLDAYSTPSDLCHSTAYEWKNYTICQEQVIIRTITPRTSIFWDAAPC